MKKFFQSKGLYFLIAILMLFIAWLSYRNFGTITYTYRLTNEKRESDYRFFQYISGDRLEVSWEGIEEAPVVTTKKAGRGTVVMIEGYGLGGDTPVHTMTLTYYVDLLMLKAKLPDMKPYWEWVHEYHVPSLMFLNSDRAVAGSSASIRVEEVDVDYQFDGVNLTRSFTGLLFGLFALFLILRNQTIKWTKSGRRAMDFLENIKTTYHTDRWQEEEILGRHELEVYVRGCITKNMGLLLLGLLISVILVPFGMQTYLVYPLLLVCVIVIFVWLIINSVKSLKKLGELLTDQCHPLALVIGATGIYGTKQTINQHMKSIYAYQSLISISFYYMGEFTFALEHLDLVWSELPRYLKNTYRIHYHMIRIKCLRMVDEEEQVMQEQKLLEALFKKKPKLKTNVYGNMYQKQESLAAFMKAGDYKEAIHILNGEITSDIPRYQQVAAHYDLWRIGSLTGDEKQREISEDFIQQYGKELFYYARIKRECQ